ncbi:hypothetical protein [Halovenus halobia]|uniref:hypothetical protein n=1 Tax=Halovenus halobia TaxID=3396622 RepID=UPI003F564488
MVSAETRAGVLTLAGVLCAALVLRAVDAVVRLAPSWHTVAAFVLFTAFGFVVPQLYLARVDDTVPLSYRRGFVLLVVLFFGAAAGGPLSPPASWVVWLLVGPTVSVIVLSEVRDGYQSVVGNEVT